MRAGLSASNLRVRYGKLVAVKEVNLSLSPGEMIALVGPNGAGKSTTAKAIVGLLKTDAGVVSIDGTPLDGMSPEKRIRHDLAYVPEDRGIFKRLTVSENLQIGVNAGKGKPARGFRRDEIFQLFPILKERQEQAAGLLSGGEQQQLAIARALLTSPRFLIIDEPSLGLAPMVIETVYLALKRVQSEHGIGIVVVEQSMRRVQKYVDRVSIIRGGITTKEYVMYGTVDLADVERAYFGLE